MLETRAASNKSGQLVVAQYPVRAAVNLASKLFLFIQPR
jgi:hypothetical protein